MSDAPDICLQDLHTELSPAKKLIVDTAREMFAQFGYDGLSIRDLAERCGLAKATIYHHFSDKHALILSVMEHSVVDLHRQLVAAGASETDTTGKLQAMAVVYCNLLAEHRSVVLSSMRANSDTQHVLREFFRTHRDLIYGPFRVTLQAGIDAGQFRSIDAQTATLGLLGMMNNMVTYCATLDEPLNTTGIAASALDLFLSGVYAKEPK